MVYFSLMQTFTIQFRRFLVFSISFFCATFLFISEPDSNPGEESGLPRLAQKIDGALHNSSLKGASVGIQIISLKSGEVVYERNPELALNPASNTKLLTSAVALVKLTPEFRFQTSIHMTGKISKGTLIGDLYLKGRGDPLLTYTGLLSLAQDVYNAGIRKISGDVIGDDSYFDQEREFSGWHDFTQAYSGKLSALSLQKNSVRLQIKPGRSGAAPSIILDPPTSYIKIKNKAVTLTSNKVYASFTPSENPENEETLLVQGKISKKSRGGVSAYVNVNNPSLFTATTFKDALEQIGIAVEGEVSLGTLPKKSARLGTYYSEPLSTIISEANKPSDNFVAEQLLKTVGAHEQGAPGSTEKGLQVLQEFLEELEIPPSAYVLENGSGLSRSNRISPQHIVTLLTYMYENFEVRYEYLASLAIAGVDGTLRKRMKDTQAERRLRAKTGAIRSVSCLSGYAASRDNEIFVFSMMMNDYKSGGYDIKKIQNNIGLLLTEFNRPTYSDSGERQTQDGSTN